MNIVYCAVCTSTWATNPDESSVSESFDEALAFCNKRIKRLKAFEIIKSEEVEDGYKEEIIISFKSTFKVAK